VDGKDVPDAKLQDPSSIIKGDDYRTKVKKMDPPGFRLKLDPIKNPKAVDMIQTQPDGTEKVIKGIYTFEKRHVQDLPRPESGAGASGTNSQPGRTPVIRGDVGKKRSEPANVVITLRVMTVLTRSVRTTLGRNACAVRRD